MVFSVLLETTHSHDEELSLPQLTNQPFRRWVRSYLLLHDPFIHALVVAALKLPS